MLDVQQVVLPRFQAMVALSMEAVGMAPAEAKIFTFRNFVLLFFAVGCHFEKKADFVLPAPKIESSKYNFQRFYNFQATNMIYKSASMRETFFNDARFEKVKFYRSNLSGTRISQSKFLGFSFKSSNLSGAKIVNSYFKNGEFAHVNLTAAFIADSVFENCTFEANTFEQAILINVKMINCHPID